MQLSWDLHVHPGPSSVPRWGGGNEIQAAAARGGLKGFVWKSHNRHTAKACAALAPAPRAIGSASLNAWATPNSVAQSITEGARWVWGPTLDQGHVGWDRPLPEMWTAFRNLLLRTDATLVLGTGHLDRAGRRAFAELAAATPRLLCSITHSLYLAANDVAELKALGCMFEIDLYTATREITGRPRVDLASGIRRLRDAGATVYLTTDCGQPEIGDPYIFSAATLTALAEALGNETLKEIAVVNPGRMAAHALGAPA